jgi:hypothetical protein
MTSFAVEKFRIVIELSQQMYGDKLSTGTILKPVEDTIMYLHRIGCTVPVLLYTDIELPNKFIFKLEGMKKKHLMLFHTTKIEQVRRFCRMELLTED